MTDSEFYENAKTYWKNVPSTMDGVLGGFAHISSADLGGSNQFLRPLIKGQNAVAGCQRALDCGAGIGRITKGLLSKYFETVDLVDVDENFIEQAKVNLEPIKGKIGNFYCSGLQDFIPEEDTYDVIWSQWVLGHLTDEHLVRFFQRCKKGLKENGILIVKENFTSNGAVDFDTDDSSYTRSKDVMIKLFGEAGLSILKEEKQKHFPKDFYSVFTFALQ